MNIEQIADAVSKEMLGNVATLQPELVKWNREYLSRCLEKLAEQDVEPVAYQSTRNGFIAKENKNPEYNVGLYTETQLLAAQQRTAEACAKLAASAHANGSMRFTHRDEILEALSNGEWREYCE